MSEELSDDPWRVELDVIRAQVQGVIIEMFKPWLEADSTAAHAEALQGITGGAIVAPIGKILDELEVWAAHHAADLSRRAADEAKTPRLPSWTPPKGWLRLACAQAIQNAGDAVAEYRKVASEVVAFMERHASLAHALRSFFRGTSRTDGVPTLSGDPQIDGEARTLERTLDAAWARVTRATEALDRALDEAVVGAWNGWLKEMQQRVEALTRAPNEEPARPPPPQMPRLNTLDLAIIRGGAAVREGPAPTFTVRHRLPNDTPVVVLDMTVPGWLKIRLGGTAGDGWVEMSSVRTQG